MRWGGQCTSTSECLFACVIPTDLCDCGLLSLTADEFVCAACPDTDCEEGATQRVSGQVAECIAGKWSQPAPCEPGKVCAPAGEGYRCNPGSVFNPSPPGQNGQCKQMCVDSLAGGGEAASCYNFALADQWYRLDSCDRPSNTEDCDRCIQGLGVKGDACQLAIDDCTL